MSSIGKLRSALYTGTRGLGDLQAAQKAVERRSVKPLADRAKRRLLGRLVARLTR